MTASSFIALFDLDHTLLPLDSDYQWADFLARTGRVGDPAEAIRLNEDLMERYNKGLLTAEESAEFMLGLLTNASQEELLAWQDEFMQAVILPSISPAARELLAQHQDQGHLVAIVTATNEFVTRPIAAALGVDHLIATTPEMKDGRYTGKISGVPSFQAGKITRVEQWLQTMGKTLADFERSWFYSDSPNDLPLMEVVTDPVATNPSDKLRAVATERNWVVIDLFADMMDSKS
ncbi:HAD family hydrolase [Alcaligenes faecalis]|jgi:HAD superfamily hydrolase (TIGR01490 family)|uniref:HAD family hydrolase n=1 Tax=Alcaligenes faecalis TaxID=511 RepID=UPI00122C58AB|nr:HAD family hydrolase [Alcaligenes faecalis]KAA1285496.1 HAD family hydrolase [Alcaligenes faecalis]